MIADSRPESVPISFSRPQHVSLAVSSSLSPLVPGCYILASSACWRSVESARDGVVCRAAPLAALLGLLAKLDTCNVSSASRQCPWRLTGRQSGQPLVCSAAAMGHHGTGRQSRSPQMIKIKSYVVIAFCYRKANILRKWSKILHFCYGNKGLCHGCRSY